MVRRPLEKSRLPDLPYRIPHPAPAILPTRTHRPILPRRHHRRAIPPVRCRLPTRCSAPAHPKHSHPPHDLRRKNRWHGRRKRWSRPPALHRSFQSRFRSPLPPEILQIPNPLPALRREHAHRSPPSRGRLLDPLPRWPGLQRLWRAPSPPRPDACAWPVIHRAGLQNPRFPPSPAAWELRPGAQSGVRDDDRQSLRVRDGLGACGPDGAGDENPCPRRRVPREGRSGALAPNVRLTAGWLSRWEAFLPPPPAPLPREPLQRDARSRAFPGGLWPLFRRLAFGARPRWLLLAFAIHQGRLQIHPGLGERNRIRTGRRPVRARYRRKPIAFRGARG